MDHRKRIRTLGSLAVLTFVGSGGAHAAEAFSADSKWMTGDWGGTRTELLEKATTSPSIMSARWPATCTAATTTTRLSVTATSSPWARTDLQKILGWHDAEFKLAITERSGRNLSNDRISDPRAGQFSSVQKSGAVARPGG